MKTVVLWHERALQLVPDQRIERGERFVHQEDRRIGGDGAREPDALLHPARKLVGIFQIPARELDGLDRLAGDLVALFLRHAADLEREGHVVADIAVRHQGHALEDHADLLGPDRAQLLGAHLVDVAPLDIDRALRRLDEAVDMADEGRLAGSRQAHDAEYLAPRHREGGIAHADDTVEPLADVLLREAALLEDPDGLLRITPENLPDSFTADHRILWLTGHSPSCPTCFLSCVYSTNFHCRQYVFCCATNIIMRDRIAKIARKLYEWRRKNQ